MSYKYEKNIELTEEGSSHRREVETTPPSSKNHYTTTTYKQVVPVSKSRDSHPRHRSPGVVARYSSGDDDDNFEEWTTSKRKVNHKTRQVETRVSRQLLVEDGKVIADSGPQVTTRIKEDNHVEECEKEKAPKNRSRFEALENAPEGESTGRVLGEKKEIQKVTREVREENMQYHDERFKELTGQDVHRRAIQAPHELITITDKNNSHEAAPRGKMVHYSNKGKKYTDRDEILEVAKLAIDGSITKEVKRTKHHQEESEDEKPDETGEAEALRDAPTVTRSSRRHVDYVNDFDDTATPSCSSDDEQEHQVVSGAGARKSAHSGRVHQVTSTPGKHRQHHEPHSGSASRHHKVKGDEEAFPRYGIDPLLNSLRDEDYRPATRDHSSSGRYKEHQPVMRNDRYESDDCEPQQHSRSRVPVTHSSNQQQQQQHTSVEIPEEYRVNKNRMLSSKTGGASQRERSFSPTSKSHLSHRSSKSNRSHHHKEDASVQAHLTDEEEERKSLRSSSSGANSHEKTTRQLQRQSTQNSRRNYYFGEGKPTAAAKQQQQVVRPKSPSTYSSSSSSLSDPKERHRKQGVRSRDSGFKSPHQRVVTPTGDQQQIYSVSSKSKRNRADAVVSPTPTSGSVGQRSVKTTTTTMSAGLADRPLSRQRRQASSRSPSPQRAQQQTFTKEKRVVESGKPAKSGQKGAKVNSLMIGTTDVSSQFHKNDEPSARQSLDNVSLSSFGPSATTIKVPYRPNLVEHEISGSNNKQQRSGSLLSASSTSLSTGTQDSGLAGIGQQQSDEMSLQESIKSLRRRLDNIDRKNTNETRKSRGTNEEKRDHFDYKTIIANVHPALPRQQVVDAYNVRVIQHDSPFTHNNQPARSVSELSSSIARLELLGSQEGGLNQLTHDPHTADNNNEANFNLADFVKQKSALPNLQNDDDNISIASSCSMRSSRTYDVRVVGSQLVKCEKMDDDNEDLDDERHFPVEVVGDNEKQDGGEHVDEQPDNDEKPPSAWIIDLRDCSSTAIKAPTRPKKPAPPKIDSKTEELAQSRGGRSYYLELIEADRQAARKEARQRPSSIDSLYSRWNSHSTLNSSAKYNQQHQSTPIECPVPKNSADTRKSRQIVPASLLDSNSRPIISSSVSNLPKQQKQQTERRQLPFAGPSSLSNRSKSSSCLLGSTRQSKYSIYGGLRKPNSENKPVPRLSYSRAIGPKSQRQLDAQSKTPSRYLKMK